MTIDPIKKRIENAVSIDHTKYGPLNQCLYERKQLAFSIARNNFSGETYKYAIDQFDRYDDMLKQLLGIYLPSPPA